MGDDTQMLSLMLSFRGARAAMMLCVLLPSAVMCFTPSSALSSARFALRPSQAPRTCMALRDPSHAEKVAVGRRESLLAAGVSFFAFPLAGNADSFEEFMAKKQKKEREEQARKQARERALSGEVDEDEDEDGATATREASSSTSTLDEYKNAKPVVDKDPVKTALYTVLRVQESTLQEARLIRTNNFKDLQRNNIKMATKMMVENTRIIDVVVKASAYATDPNKVSEADEKGKAAVQDLLVILDYFDEVDQEVKVTDLPKEKREFILKALDAARGKFDEFLAYMPKEKVKEARDQVIMENELNRKELPKDLEILNPVFMN